MMPHVTQQELFIRAATEGRRDHVYQAAMFDPLTAATLPPDKIVELCDELIAAHGFVKDGGCLPDLDAKRTLVPTSGKPFGRVDATELRRSWDAAQAKAGEDHLRTWHVLGPFPGPRTPLDDAMPPDGTVDLATGVRAGDHLITWRPATAAKDGFVNLARALGDPAAPAAAYAYAEVDAIHPRETVLRVGSAGGLTVWLNGRVVHTTTADRQYHPGDDEPPVHLDPGPTACSSNSRERRPLGLRPRRPAGDLLRRTMNFIPLAPIRQPDASPRVQPCPTRGPPINPLTRRGFSSAARSWP